MWSVHITALTQEEADFLSAEFFELVTAGLEETPTGLRAYFEDSILPNTIRQAFPGRVLTIETSLPPVVVEEAADRDPILIGRRFVLVPADRIVLPIDAAMAFGSGRHETTQLCLEALEKHMRPGDTVYDVGCGSGILALAALRLGAGRVIAADTCQSAIAVARRHFPGLLFVGSANCFQAHSADIVLSNITGKVNDQIAAELARITKPTGFVIVSGFITETAPKNFYPDEILTLADWHCWICKPFHITSPNIISNETRHNPEWWI